MRELQALLDSRPVLTGLLWTDDDIVFTYGNGAIRVVARLVKVNPPQKFQIGLEVRDGVEWTALERHGEIIMLEAE